MFSRAAKSIVQSLNQRSYHVTKGNFKAAVGSTGEVVNSTAQFSQQPRLDSSAVREIMPFKNLKFNNITPNSAERQTLSGVGARAVEGTAAEGNVQAIDLVQLRGLGPVIGSVNSTAGFYKNLQNVRNSMHTVARRNFGTSLQPTFYNNNSRFVNNASRSYSKCSGKKDGCNAPPPNPCPKPKPSTCPDPNQRLISPCKSRPPCSTPGPEKCENPCDKPKCPPPCSPPPAKCPPPPCPPPCPPPPPKCPPPCPPPAPKCPPSCFPPATKCPRPTPKCPPPCPPRPCDPCPKPCKPPKCPPRCPLDPPPPCPPPPPPKCPEPPRKCCDKPKPPPKCPESEPQPCCGPKPVPHSPTPRESCSAPKRSCEVPLEKMLEESRKRSPPKTTCCPPPTPPPPRSICCPTPPKETCCPAPKPMPSCVPPEKMPKPCPEQKASCPPPTPTCIPPKPAPPCCPEEPACTPGKKKTTRQSFWKKLTRKMSTHSGNSGVLKTGQPRFKVPSRRFAITSVSNLAAYNRGWSKCKTGEDICAELDPVCKRLCKKKPATRCSTAEKPCCAERMRIAKKAREAEDERSQKRPLKCPTCLPAERCQPPVVPPASERMEYPVTVCSEPPPCPSYKDKVEAEPVVVCPPLPQLPKPPSAPVVLCPCPPPPKLPPGPCPCLDSAKEVKLLVPIYLPPCARKAKYTCERKVYSCKLQRNCDKRACPRDDETDQSQLN